MSSSSVGALRATLVLSADAMAEVLLCFTTLGAPPLLSAA